MAHGKKTGGRQVGTLNKATAALKDLAQPYAPEAIETLRQIMLHGETDAARVAAARELLDRGYGRSVQALTGANDTALIPDKPQSLDELDVVRRMAFLLAKQSA
ncbi:MAG: hypothetical protein WBK91_03820 [Alphaproteobacteria bacterium]